MSWQAGVVVGSRLNGKAATLETTAAHRDFLKRPQTDDSHGTRIACVQHNHSVSSFMLALWCIYNRLHRPAYSSMEKVPRVASRESKRIAQKRTMQNQPDPTALAKPIPNARSPEEHPTGRYPNALVRAPTVAAHLLDRVHDTTSRARNLPRTSQHAVRTAQPVPLVAKPTNLALGRLLH